MSQAYRPHSAALGTRFGSMIHFWQRRMSSSHLIYLQKTTCALGIVDDTAVVRIIRIAQDVLFNVDELVFSPCRY